MVHEPKKRRNLYKPKFILLSELTFIIFYLWLPHTCKLERSILFVLLQGAYFEWGIFF